MAISDTPLRPEPSSIPDEPGCYQFRDADGVILYVGKAKSLRARVSSYFAAPASLPTRTRAMLEAAADVQWIVVDTETAALHLEYTLIQRHRPRFNIQYRDDKSYPYLVLTTSETVPRVRVQRGRIKREDQRFGPYAHAHAIRDTLDSLLPIFPVRTCAPGVYDRAQRTGQPCLLHHIGRCAAPCTGEIDIDVHRELVERLARFLRGDSRAVRQRLEQEMQTAAEQQHFELAARRRDQIVAVQRVLERQQVVSDREDDFDVVGVDDSVDEAAVYVLYVRKGRLVGQKGIIVDKVEEVSVGAMLTSVLVDVYASRADEIPPLIVVPEMPDDADVLVDLLREQRREMSRRPGNIDLRIPQRGSKRALLATAEANAAQTRQRARLKRANDFDSRSRALGELQRALNLREAPFRMECYDISHLGGTDVVGSMVVFEDGLPRPRDYRRFKLRVDANDDYAAMAEVIRRRFHRLGGGADAARSDADEAFARRPNLVVIDGGPGQLHAALGSIGDIGVDVDVVALAKRFEEVWRPDVAQPVQFGRGSDARYLLQRIRDEAHRFAIQHQRRRRRRRVTASVLD
ncbi:MAG: excinuclease ABC subunit UvrC, partial [Nitriliruptoraceae bacterium]